MSETAEKFQFKAEVKQLLDILVHSLYTSREIFLRELVSNASDALDKLRFESNRGTEIVDKDLPLEIRIDFDEKEKTITVKDTGIGMTKDELINNIGTIAKSGSAEFLKTLQESKGDANNIIGKFGVGFYSVFMIAKEVVIKSKSFKADAPAIEWKSDGLGDFEIKEIDEKLERGTTIIIHLKDDAVEYASDWKLKGIVNKHSNFINFPIFIKEEKVNTVNAIWREPKSSVTKEQYDEFYKFLSYDTESPLEVIHKSVDAPIQFNSLLFIPKKSDEYFWMNKDNYGLDLYVRRVLIQHKNKDLLPEYLSFVKGIVDSEDLPLNISRETLQENAVFSKISQSVTNQILSQLADIAKNDSVKYNDFWKEHGRVFKLSYMDFVNQEKIVELLRFNSSFNEKKEDLSSIAEYAARMKEDQKEIYYAFGTSREGLALDPHLEIFRDKGIEVLYLFDPIDEFVISAFRKYKDFEFKSVENADAKKLEKFSNLKEKEKKFDKLAKDDKKQFSSLLSKMKSILGDKIEDIKETERLSGSPACLSSKDEGLTSSMKKILKMQNQDMGQEKRILEINPDHTLVRNMITVFKKNAEDEFIVNVTNQLYESALLLEGNLEDPHALVDRLNKMLEQSSEWYVKVKSE
ncbi:MAG: molecular chaperone HtpG [Melioribacteraceae bacterium]|nr:molecular chaperone HtpG [Melioribacteraceae bacterium]